MKKSEEASHQEAFFQWLSYYPIEYSLTWHTPNGGYRNTMEAVRFKKQGVKPGVPDIFMAIPTSEFHGLFIEMKSKLGKLTLFQKKTIESLRGSGYKVCIAYSWHEAREHVKQYLGWNNV